MTEITGTFRGDLCAFMIILRWILLRMVNFSDKSCRGTRNTYFMLNNVYLKNCTVLK